MAAGFFNAIDNSSAFENHRQKCRFCFKMMPEEESSAHMENAAKLFADLMQWKLQISDKYSSKKVCLECFDVLLNMARIKNQSLKNQLKYEECLMEEEMMDTSGMGELVQIPLNIELELNSDSTDEKHSDIQITNVEYLDLDTRERNSVMDLTASSSEVYEMSESQKMTTKNPDLQKSEYFTCNVCSYRCLKLAHLKFHALTHLPTNTRKTFKCNICGANLLHKNSLKLHILKKHAIHSNYNCGFCDSGFNLLKQYESHMKLYHFNTK